uniref:Uncharacterized protein n=1 Tax=Anguilla anguilla TaxID=7936 RepID=A0A0E9WWX3_ANGAN
MNHTFLNTETHFIIKKIRRYFFCLFKSLHYIKHLTKENASVDKLPKKVNKKGHSDLRQFSSTENIPEHSLHRLNSPSDINTVNK